MSIIIEGADNSGKSTLAQFIATALNMKVQSSEGPEKYKGEIAERIKRYNSYDSLTIFDRHPCVSQEIYRKVNYTSAIDQSSLTYFYLTGHIFIFCLDRGLNEHIVKSHDTTAHIRTLVKNHEDIAEEYRRWALKHAHLIYRAGEDKIQVVNFLRGVVP